MEFIEKKIIVTGGVKGIGRALVNQLASQGAIVGILDIDQSGLNHVDSEKHKNIYCFYCNVADIDSVENAVNKFYNKFGGIDVLVNNAGLLYSAPLIGLSEGKLKKHDVDVWNKILSVNLSSVFFMTSSVVEKMIIKRTKGVIVNISSVAAAGNSGQSAYSSAKAGVNALTKTWAKELSPWGIRVTGVAPGYCGTESTYDVM